MADSTSNPPALVYSKTKSSMVRKTSVTVLTASIQLLDNANDRLGMVIFNNSSNSVYISFEATAVAASCIYIIPTFASVNFMYPYIGKVSAIRNSGTGVVTAWEFYEAP